jgi:hypothetical protein
MAETRVLANAVGAFDEAEAVFSEQRRIDELNPWALLGVMGAYGKTER